MDQNHATAMAKWPTSRSTVHPLYHNKRPKFIFLSLQIMFYVLLSFAVWHPLIHDAQQTLAIAGQLNLLGYWTRLSFCASMLGVSRIGKAALLLIGRTDFSVNGWTNHIVQLNHKIMVKILNMTHSDYSSQYSIHMVRVYESNRI